MKQITLILALLFALTANAFATDIILSGQQTAQIPFNPSNLGNVRTFTVTATTSSATVTSSAAFPSNIVGKSGFTISIGGVFYTVAAVPSTSSLTLTKAFTGSTGSTTLTLYPYTLFRAYPTAGFQSSTVTSTAKTVAVTSGSATVTSAAQFPAMYTGVAGGYQVLIDGVPYQVLWQASTSSLVLTQTYNGTSGAATMTFDGVAENVQPSAPGGQWFKEVAVSVVNLGSGNVLYYPSFVMPATTNATVNNQARYVFVFYRPDNSQLAIYQCGAQSQLAIPAATPTTWTAICSYNSPGGVVPPNTEVYTKSQIDQRFPPCVAGQSYYFAANGNIVSCLNFGSGLTLTGNTLTASGGGGGGTNIIQGYNAKLDGGCLGDGVTNDTACLNAALIAANAAGRQFFLPAGTYLANLTIAGLNSQRIFGEGPGRTIIQSAVGTSPVLFANNATGLTHSLTIEELSLNGFGSGASDYGFRMSPDQPFDLTLRNVRVGNTNSGGIYIPTNAFTMQFDGVDVSTLGGNGFDIFGDNTIILQRTYVHSVGSGGTAYRLRSGRFVLLAANGIDSGTNASWGVFGDTLAEDGADAYAYVTFQGSNVEAWTSTSYGVRVKAGSRISVYDTHFITGVSITTSAILFDDADPNLDGSFVGQLDGLSAFTLGSGSAWTNSFPVRSKGVPFYQDGNRMASYYDTTLGSAVLMPYRSNALNGPALRGVAKFNRLTLGTAANEGYDGNLNFIDDNTRAIGTSGGAGRPQHIYVGDGGVHLGAGAVPFDGTNFTLTGGSSPLLSFADGTVAGRFQLVTGTSIQFGTTTSHPLNVLTAGTNTWQWTTAGNLIVTNGSRTIGEVAGNRPSAIYGLLFDSGISGTSTGVYIFRNSTNVNVLTLQGGVSTSSFAITLPTTLPAGTECLQIGNTGIITPTGGACGSGAGTVSSVSFTGGLISVATATTTPALTVAGTSGGIPYFSSASTWASSAALTANLPVIGGGAGVAPTVGTRSGNTTAFVTTTGTLTSGRCVEIDASGNFIQSAAACSSGGGITINTTTITGGTTTRLLYDNAGTVGEISTLTSDGTIVTYAGTGTTGTTTSAGLVVTANALTTGTGVYVGSTSTAGSSTTTKLVDIAKSGAQTGTVTTTAASIANTSTGASATNVALTLTASGATTANMALNVTAGTIVQTSASATAFESGPAGGTNPVFRLVNSVASQATGISVTGRAAAAGVDITALSSGADEQLSIFSKGAATIKLNQTTFVTQGGGGAGGAGELRTPQFFVQDIANVVFAKFSGNGGSNAASNPVLLLAGTMPIGWNSAATNTGGSFVHDVNIGRVAAGVIRLGNGGTSASLTGGSGSLLIAPSSATVTGNFTVLPDNAATAAVVDVARFGVNSTGTALAGFGGQVSFTLESSTTNDQVAGLDKWYWLTPTHASRGSVVSRGNVSNALSIDRDFLTPRKTLTDATATNIVTITLPTLTGASGFVDYEAYAADATDVQVRRGTLAFSVVNKAGAYTSESSIVNEAASVSAGTFTCTFDFSNGSNQTTLRANCDTSLTATTLYIIYTLRNSSEQAMTIQ